MTTTRRQDGTGAQLRVAVAGEIDLVTSPVLAEALERARQDALTIAGPSRIVADLREVEFLSASGIRVLVEAHDRCHGNAIPLCVAANHTAVTRPLILTGLNAQLGLHPGPDTPPGT